MLTKSILVALDRDPTAFPEVPEGNLALLSFKDGNYETIVPGQIRWNSPQLDAQAVQLPEPSGAFAIVAIAGPAIMLMILITVTTLTGRSLSPLTWYLTRASGLTLYLLLWASLMLGLGITSKSADRLMSRSIAWSLHTFVTQLAYGFLMLHLLTLLADTHLPFTLLDILLPFSSNAVEPWTGLGVVSMYLLAIIGLSGPARRFIDFKAWKLVHLLAFPLFFLSLFHGIGGGSDTSAAWVAALYFLTTLVGLLAHAVSPAYAIIPRQTAQ